MDEHEVYWVGQQPLALNDAEKKQPMLGDDPAFVQAITAACAAAGYPLERFISALGPYGTWLAEIKRESQTQRVLWNGKDQQLVLQVPLQNGGWEDPLIMEVAVQDQDGFVAGVTELLS